jgi:hypothetical protein
MKWYTFDRKEWDKFRLESACSCKGSLCKILDSSSSLRKCSQKQVRMCELIADAVFQSECN